MDARRRRGRRKERTDRFRRKKPLFFLKAPLRGEGCDGALLTCEVPVELVTPNRSNKLVEDSAGRLRPTAAARMNGNSLLSKLDKRCGQEAGCSGAPARRRPGGRHGRRSLGRSTALTHEALACAGRAATPPRVKNARKSEKIRYFPPGGLRPPDPPARTPLWTYPPVGAGGGVADPWTHRQAGVPRKRPAGGQEAAAAPPSSSKAKATPTRR